MKSEVSDTYKQFLKEDGNQVLIETCIFFLDDSLKITPTTNSTSVLLPLDPMTKAKLQRIESFVKENVKSEMYKPLLLEDSMFVMLSKWCNYVLINPDYSRRPLPTNTFLGKGRYTAVIHVSHVYIGPHQGGQTFSLSLTVKELTYKPEEICKPRVDVSRDKPVTFSFLPATSTPKKTQQKRIRGPARSAGQDEVAHVQSSHN